MTPNGDPTQGGLVLDLFAGPGGWSEGLRALGLRDVGIEWDWSACLTRKAAGHLTICADVATYPTEPFVAKLWGLIASAPCTLFSTAGRGTGTRVLSVLAWAIIELLAGRDVRDRAREAVYPTALAEQQARNAKRKPEKKWTDAKVEHAARHDAFICCLVLEPARFVHDCRPEWVALEQVPAVAPLWGVYAAHMRPMGYSVWAEVLNAADYGVPQTRERAILGASLTRTALPPAPTHCKGGSPLDLFGGQLLPHVSMASALGWGATDRPVPTVTAGGTATGGAEPIARGGREALIESKRGGGMARAFRLHRGAGMTERHGQRPDAPAEGVAPTITSKARTARWVGPS